MEGNFNVGGTIQIPSHRVFEGSGINTIITAANGLNVNIIENLDQTGGNTNICVKNLQIDGNAAQQSAMSMGIEFKKVTNTTVHDIFVHDTDSDGIFFSRSSNSAIDRILAIDTGNHSIFAGYGSSYMTISNIVSRSPGTEHVCIEWTDSGTYNEHITVDNVVGDDSSNYAFYSQHSRHVSWNNCIAKTSTNNPFYILDAEHISFSNCQATSTIASQDCFHTTATANDIHFSNCIATGEGAGVGATGFEISGEDVTLLGCSATNCFFGVDILGNGITLIGNKFINSTNPTFAIRIKGANGVFFMNNALVDSVSPYPSYAVGVETLSPTSIVTIQGNDFSRMTVGTAMCYADGTGIVITRNNVGWVTENSGTDTLVAGTTSKAVTHGLAVTPVAGDIMISPLGSLRNASEFWISAYSSTTFTITVDADPTTGGILFGWKAIVL